MARFDMVVSRGSSAPFRLTLQASSRDEALRKAESDGLVVLRSEGAAAGKLAQPQVARKDLIVLLEQMQALLKAGLGLSEALGVLCEGRDTRGSSLAKGLLASIRQGASLSEAMGRTTLYPQMLVSLVAASEVTSRLPNALEEYLAHAKRAEEVKAKVINVVLYPAMVLAIGAFVVCFLALVVVPRFAQVFAGMQGELPWAANVMLWWRQFLQQHMAIALTFLLSPVVALVLAWRAGSLEVLANVVLGSSPRLASAMRTYHLARWFRSTALLVEGGIPFPEAVALSSEVLPAEHRSRSAAVVKAMRGGASPSQAYDLAGLSTPVLGRMLAAGEQGGQAGQMLRRAADFHEKEVLNWLEGAMRLAEPAAMALIGVIVGGLVIVMYLPVFELASAIR